MRNQRLGDPQWKSGPTYPEPTASEHDERMTAVDMDGVGRDEADEYGDLFCATFVRRYCGRDGCEADTQQRWVYHLDDVSERTKQAARHAIDWTDDPTDEDIIEALSVRAEVIDWDAQPVISFVFGDDHLGYVYPHASVGEGSMSGQCYGHVEPDYESQWRDV